MNAQDKADWEFWKRIAKIFNTNLHSWSYQHSASFVNPQMEIDGRAAAKLIEQDAKITYLKSLARCAIHTAADMAAIPIEEWAEKTLRELDNA